MRLAFCPQHPPTINYQTSHIKTTICTIHTQTPPAMMAEDEELGIASRVPE
jgi:hypothetical protein